MTKPAPCFLVELVWRTHLLSPRKYLDACTVLKGQAGIVAHSPAAVEMYAEDDRTNAFGGATVDASWLGLDLVAALRRQEMFMQSVLSRSAFYGDDVVLGAAVAEYRDFLACIRSSEKELVPSELVDLVWHTHMLFPHRYAAETCALAGSFVDHEDDVEQDRMAAAVSGP